MATLDWLIILAYFTALAGLTWWVLNKNKDTAEDYFLAGRGLGWFIVGASIFASNIGSEHLVGLAGAGATSGLPLAHYELHAWCLLVLGWVFVPFYLRSKVFTTPEFLERRFSGTARWVLSLISVVGYILTKIAVSIFAGGVVFRAVIPELGVTIAGHHFDAFWVGSVSMVVVTGLYSVAGGLRAVAYTEVLQTFVLVGGSLVLTMFGLNKLGGWGQLRATLDPEMFNLWKPLVRHGFEGTWSPVITQTHMAYYFNDDYPWLGMLFCAPIVGLWYWCTDQHIVQRTFMAPNETEARRGTIFGAFLKLSPVFIFIIPGMIALALAKSGKVPELAPMIDAAGNPVAAVTQGAYPMLVRDLLPIGIRGAVVAGLLAALMTSLAAAYNACSTLFTMDFWIKFRPKSTQAELVWVGRLATTVMVLIGLAWIPVIQGSRGLYDYLQGVQGYLAPPIFVVFFFGVFNKRLNASGCLWALTVGFALGAFRLAIDTPVTLKMAGFENGYPEGSFFWIVNHIYFQYYSLFITVVSIAVMFAVSYMGEAPSEQQLAGLTYATVTAESKAVTRASWNQWDVINTCIVLGLILAAYIYFSG